MVYKRVKSIFLMIALFIGVTASGEKLASSDTTPLSTHDEAIAFIEKIDKLAPSDYWPGVDANLFLKNLKWNAHNPLSIYEGISTNFCGYGALSYLFLHDNPLGYVKFMLQLYKEGKTFYGKITFDPSPEIHEAVGRLQYKGKLDIRPADQMLFLCLADRFKGYLNFFSGHYKPGKEDALWACVNYAKFNRMVKELLNYKVRATGADLIRPYLGNIYKFLSERLKLGRVVMYVNNKELHQVSHALIRVAFPTHYVILEQLEEADGKLTITYWDYGGRTRIQVTPKFLRKIVYGVSLCTKKVSHE